MCQNLTLLESPNFLQFDWLSNGANWVGKVKQTKSPSLRFFFLRTPLPNHPIKDQSLRHGPNPSPAGPRCVFESREVTLL